MILSFILSRPTYIRMLNADSKGLPRVRMSQVVPKRTPVAVCCWLQSCFESFSQVCTPYSCNGKRTQQYDLYPVVLAITKPSLLDAFTDRILYIGKQTANADNTLQTLSDWKLLMPVGLPFLLSSELIAFTARRYASAANGICCRHVSVSVCLSVRHGIVSKRQHIRDTQKLLHDSPRTLVSWRRRQI